MSKKLFENEIYAYSLENAITFGEAKPSVVLPKLFQHDLEKESIPEIMPKVNEIVEKVNSLSKEEKMQMFEKYKKFVKEHKKEELGLKDLSKVSGKPVFRLSPFPSGSIHIGNARTFLLNVLYAEKYKGKILLVIDDTIGSEEKQIVKEAYKLIPEAFNYLDIKYKKPIIYKSDRLEIYYKYAKQLIKKDVAYVCSCSQKEIRENRLKRRECSCRQFNVKEQLKKWKKMFKAKPGDYTLRIKTSMQDPDPAFRDRVLLRISDRPHPRKKRKYRVWPLLEFSWAIDDHLLGVTHIIRGKDLMIEGKMQEYIWDIFKWKKPQFIYNGMMKVGGVGKLAKSKSQKEVKSGKYLGWDDPRTWSVQSLARRGILTSSIRKFVEKIGLTQKDITIPIDDLYAINRRKLDKVAKRFFFVENPVEIQIENAPEIKEKFVRVLPESDELKELKLRKEIFVALKDFNKFKGKEIRLMHLYNLKLDKNSVFTSHEINSKIQKIHWVSKKVNARILMPDGNWSEGFAEESIKELKKGEIIQFERFGFCKFDGKNKGQYIFWFAHE